MSQRIIVASLVLLSAGPAAACIKSAADAALVARLYPTGQAAKFAAHEGGAANCLQVGPMQRDGKWGFVDEVFTVKIAPDMTMVAFHFMVGADAPDGVNALRNFDYLKQQPIEVRYGLQVILLDARGKFVDKPMDMPLLANATLGCVGDMCGSMGVYLDSFTAVPGTDRAALLKYRKGGAEWAEAMLWTRGDLLSSEPVKLEPGEDLSGCDRGTRLKKVAFVDNKVEATLEDHCNVEMCPDECRGLGLSKDRKTAERHWTLVGGPP